MRRALLLAPALALALALTGEAQAVTLAPGSLGDSRTLHMAAVARAYWHGEPAGCPQGVRITVSDDQALFDSAGDHSAQQNGGGAFSGADAVALYPCTVLLSAQAWFLDPSMRNGGDARGFGWNEAYCVAMVHEWGHLTLGPTYFAGANPADPVHSPDPQSIMYYDPTFVPAGCVHAKSAKRHGRHHRHHRRALKLQRA